MRVQWSDIKWEDREVRLRAEITKKQITRYIKVSDNAMAWLMEYKRRGGSTEGAVVKYPPNRLRSRSDANYRRAGVTSKQNAARHSYCSYHVSMHRDIDDLTLQSGHASNHTLWRHYYQVATKKDAERYWSVVPKGAATNIVAFNAYLS